MGCSASTQHAIAAADGLPRAKRDPPAADKHAGDSPGRRFEAPFSGASAEAPLAGVKVSKRGGPLQFASLSPAMVILDEFLTDEECEGLVALASGDLRRSRVTDGHVSSGRTSFSTFLTGAKASHPLVTLIESRVTQAVSEAQALLDVIDCAPENAPAVSFVAAEPLQVVRYSVSQGYCAHYDNRAQSLARKVTFMVYLNDVEAGGHTFFPRARPATEEVDDAERPPGIRIQPRKGRALIFWNIRQGREDEASLHEAQPVLSGGKLVATKWLSTTQAVPDAPADAAQ